MNKHPVPNKHWLTTPALARVLKPPPFKCRIVIHERAKRNWVWQVFNFWDSEVAHGENCEKKSQARALAREAKTKYLIMIRICETKSGEHI